MWFMNPASDFSKTKSKFYNILQIDVETAEMF